MTESNRAKYGSLKKLTKKQYREHKNELSRRWRANNPDKVVADNRRWYEYYKAHPRFESVCVLCNTKFKCARKGAKICPKCLSKQRGK